MENYEETDKLFEKFTKDFSPDFKEIAQRICSTVFKAKSDFDIGIKWRQFTFAQNHDFHHWICAIKSTKKSVDLVFHYGSLLEETGISKRERCTR